MSEKHLWHRVRDKIAHFGHFSRVESQITPGFPDVDYCLNGVDGKIELKFRRDWPKQEGTGVFIKDGLREGQELWIKERIRHGGRVFILAQVDKTLLLIEGRHAQQFNTLTRLGLETLAVWKAEGVITNAGWLELMEVLCKYGALAAEEINQGCRAGK